jgi:hypothetical protein
MDVTAVVGGSDLGQEGSGIAVDDHMVGSAGRPCGGQDEDVQLRSRPAVVMRAGSNVVRPIKAASQPWRKFWMPWLSPETKAGSAVKAGQPAGVVT